MHQIHPSLLHCFWGAWEYFLLHSPRLARIIQMKIRTRVRFLSLTWSKLRLCSANHRAGYFSNLACDWLSIVWAYSAQETENGPLLLSTLWGGGGGGGYLLQWKTKTPTTSKDLHIPTRRGVFLFSDWIPLDRENLVENLPLVMNNFLVIGPLFFLF